MSGRMAKYGTATAVLAIIVSLFVFSWLALEVDFPTFEYTSDELTRQLVPSKPYDSIAALASRFLWEHRALDLTGQAFVIVAAVICCLALLKPEEEG
jgi:hypothetical protein